MTYRLINGDYVPDGAGGLQKTEGIEELLQNALLQLTATRGRFYPDKDFGSGLKANRKAPKNEWAAALARQALDKEDGVYVIKAEQHENEITFLLNVNKEEKEVTVRLENNI